MRTLLFRTSVLLLIATPAAALDIDDEVRIPELPGRLRHEERLIRYFYAGRYSGEREMIKSYLSSGGEALPDLYRRRLSIGSNPVVLDVRNGTNTAGKGYIKEGQLLQRALRAFSFDLPLSLLELHESLHEGDHFNPKTSYDRVHKVIARLRTWFKKNRLPLDIVDRGDLLYELKATKPVVLLVPHPDREASLTPRLNERDRRDLDRLKKRLGRAWFSAAEANAVLKGVRKTTVRLMNRCLESGAVERAGAARAVRYRLTVS